MEVHCGGRQTWCWRRRGALYILQANKKWTVSVSMAWPHMRPWETKKKKLSRVGCTPSKRWPTEKNSMTSLRAPCLTMSCQNFTTLLNILSYIYFYLILFICTSLSFYSTEPFLWLPVQCFFVISKCVNKVSESLFLMPVLWAPFFLFVLFYSNVLALFTLFYYSSLKTSLV